MPMSFVLSAAAGGATLLGALFAVVKKDPSRELLSPALGFSAGVMIAMSLTDLMPHAISAIAIEMPGAAGTIACLCAFAAGILSARLLDIMVDESGKNSSRLMRVGLFSMLALMLHNIPEGIAVYLSAEQDIVLGAHLCAAIALHNIPEGIAVAMPVCAATKSRFLALAMAAVSGMAEPLGAMLADRFIGSRVSERELALIFSAIAGLMTATAFYELLPEAFYGKCEKSVAAGAVFGVFVMVLGYCIAA